MRRSPVFQTDSIATLTEKHRGYRGLHLQTPVVKKRVPGSQGSYLRTRRWEYFLLVLISCRDTMNRLGNLSCADFHLKKGTGAQHPAPAEFLLSLWLRPSAGNSQDSRGERTTVYQDCKTRKAARNRVWPSFAAKHLIRATGPSVELQMETKRRT